MPTRPRSHRQNRRPSVAEMGVFAACRDKIRSTCRLQLCSVFDQMHIADDQANGCQCDWVVIPMHSQHRKEKAPQRYRTRTSSSRFFQCSGAIRSVHDLTHRVMIRVVGHSCSKCSSTIVFLSQKHGTNRRFVAKRGEARRRRGGR